MNTTQIKDNIWEIKQQEGMNSPARIFASHKLLEKMKDDKTLKQVKNMAYLPGIQKYSLVLPDGHQGYGFPIGGVTALDSEEGAISPGGIGYDINCLSGDSRVLLEFGRSKKIKNLKKTFAENEAEVAANKIESSNIQLLTEREGKTVYEVQTETGEKIEVTKDHKFMTPDGMKRLKNLSEGQNIMIRPFQGVPDKKSPEFTILDEDDFEQEDSRLVKVLKKRNLLPLKSTNKELNILLKLVGFHTGDGSFNKHGSTTFYAKKEDLKSIQKDIERLGFKSSKIYSREREHKIKEREFSRTEHSIKSTSQALQKVLIKLGAPKGNKTDLEFSIPQYLDNLAKWQKALYLSTFFGAEMNSPKSQHGKNFYCPKISQNKSIKKRESGNEFMKDIKKLLKELGIKTNKIESFETKENEKGRVIRFRLGIKNNSKNLINFFEKIGYRYNLEKQKKSTKAIQYLKTKQIAINRKNEVAKKSIKLYENGAKPKEIKKKFDINKRFIERSIDSGRKTSSRPPKSFPTFKRYSKEISVNDNLTIPSTLKSIKRRGEKTVYDLGVEHKAHNFISNRFVVSNCGVRVIKTNLKEEDLEGKKNQLLNILFNKIPLGLGKGKTVDVSRDDFNQIMRSGMKWAQENGYATKKDLKHTEENGSMEGNPDKVSNKAVNRGINQVGSLGSGNHFLEVQKVSEIFDKEAAQSFGLEEGQITISIHTGSRGFGHQVCSDYLRKMEKKYKKISKQLPDKELIYAPAEDDLAQDYYQAMKSAANFAWTNRQLITHNARQCFSTIFDKDWEDLGMEMIYGIAHNIAKLEKHKIKGKKRQVYVHRKGATRSFAPGRKEIPKDYRKTGQPVIIPGSMGSPTYILKGTKKAMDLTFGSTAHGAGRLMSRTGAKKEFWGEDVQKDLKRRKILVKSGSGGAGIAEEAPGAYKNIDEVVNVSNSLGIGQKTAKMVPLLNVKG